MTSPSLPLLPVARPPTTPTKFSMLAEKLWIRRSEDEDFRVSKCCFKTSRDILSVRTVDIPVYSAGRQRNQPPAYLASSPPG